jgi:hypothetical protein
MKQRSIRLFLFSFFLLLYTTSASAQYWGVWEGQGQWHSITLGLSSDEKWAFFIQKNDAGVDNIFKVELKTNAVTPVTNFSERPVLSGIVLFGKSPAVVFSRAASTKGDDIHLYRINVLTTDLPIDFTPKDGTSTKRILGMADNGRYVYYLSDQGAGTKMDTYRYDTQQYITELAFANDKDYETLSWSHDQTQLLLRDPKSGIHYRYSIESTDKQPTDSSDAAFKGFYVTNIGNLSLNQKYIHVPFHKEKIVDATSKAEIPLPAGAYDLIIGPKEASILYANKEGNATKLFLFDIAKKTSKELTTIK